MITTHAYGEYLAEIRAQAEELNGETVTVHLVGGQTLTGTLTFVPRPLTFPADATEWPKALTVNVETKTHTVRLDHVSSIGQG
ncbi:hypothetical protein EF913_23115 [Streptomyces sp. WAC04189]|uniref:hypothetical protein n=1 Tax=Streptomyces TaxID=1883 RepID=UPI000FAE9FD6|nr:hypothetical protein [Streptomyces sp. WAC04189]RSR99567.1 hypothetical protein EF913_23115 [Streptomyces sp. WAC04189]